MISIEKILWSPWFVKKIVSALRVKLDKQMIIFCLIVYVIKTLYHKSNHVDRYNPIYNPIYQGMAYNVIIMHKNYIICFQVCEWFVTDSHILLTCNCHLKHFLANYFIFNKHIMSTLIKFWWKSNRIIYRKHGYQANSSGLYYQMLPQYQINIQ